MTDAQWSISHSLSSSESDTGSAGPFLIPPNADKRTDPFDICIYGPFTATQNLSAPSPSQIIFSLSRCSKTAINVTLTKAHAWSENAEDRSNMATAFKTFRAEIETLESGSPAKLPPGSSELIVNRIAAALPLRLDEILFYTYGFDQLNQTVDLWPGMALGIDWSGYQYCDGPDGDGFSRNSFVTSGQSTLHVTRRRDGTLALNSFSSQFSHGITIEPPKGGPVLAGGPLDLQLLGNGRRHLRLIWPTTFSAPWVLNNSSTGNQLSVMLIGAASYADLESATALALAGRSPCDTESDTAEPIVCITFSSRVTITPQIWIWINGLAQLVPLGTTVRDIMQRYADPTPQQLGNTNTNTSAGAPDHPLIISRWYQQNVAPNTGEPTNNYNQIYINLQSADQQQGSLGDGFDLPLIKGDSLYISLPQPTPQS